MMADPNIVEVDEVNRVAGKEFDMIHTQAPIEATP